MGDRQELAQLGRATARAINLISARLKEIDARLESLERRVGGFEKVVRSLEGWPEGAPTPEALVSLRALDRVALANLLDARRREVRESPLYR